MSKDGFRETLKGRASKTRAQAAAELKRKPMSLPNMWTTMLSLIAEMNEIRSLVSKSKTAASGPTRFVIEERDGSGKVKSFRVEVES